MQPAGEVGGGVPEGQPASKKRAFGQGRFGRTGNAWERMGKLQFCICHFFLQFY